MDGKADDTLQGRCVTPRRVSPRKNPNSSKIVPTPSFQPSAQITAPFSLYLGGVFRSVVRHGIIQRVEPSEQLCQSGPFMQPCKWTNKWRLLKSVLQGFSFAWHKYHRWKRSLRGVFMKARSRLPKSLMKRFWAVLEQTYRVCVPSMLWVTPVSRNPNCKFLASEHTS